MSNLKTAIAAENEIMKAADVTFGYDSVIDNIAVAMKSILSGSENDYVIGGKVTPYSSGGMNVSIAPIYAFKNSTGKCVAETVKTEPVSFEEADSALDRIDIIEVLATETTYDTQTRAINDPTTGTKSYVSMATKKKITATVTVKKGSNGSGAAPAVDAGYVKLAEVIIPAGINNITKEYIKNIDSHKGGIENTAWTIDKAVTFNPGYLADTLYNFLVSHNEDGSHKSAVISAANIDFGTDNGKVKGSVLPTGQSYTMRKVDFTSSSSVTGLITALVAHINSVYPYSNNLLNRFSFITDIPVAASTANVNIETGGEQTIDGITCTAGQLVFLKDQTDAKENGFYEVQTGAWNRYAGYAAAAPTAFSNKFIVINSGTENAGKIFYLADDSLLIGTDELTFNVAIYTAKSKVNTVMVRDANGRSEAEEPASDKQIANKSYTDMNIARNTGVSGVGFTYGNERFVTFDFTDTAHKSIVFKAGTHIRLDIVTDNGNEKRWFDVTARTSKSLATMMTTAAAASSTRTGQINGREFYVYLVPSGTGVDIVVSCNSTYPNDISSTYTANNTRKIAQFATLCTAAGSALTCIAPASPSTESVGNKYLLKQYTSDDVDGFYDFYNKTITAITTGTHYDILTMAHPLAGFAAGDILPESVFCLSFRPLSNADGMVYDIDTDIAVDIYLQSGKGRLTSSVFGGTITDSRPEQNHQDDMRQVRKRLLWDYEFTSIAAGSNEATNISGSVDPGTTGGHVDTASRRMISNIGCEDCCGAMWQWAEDCGPAGGSGDSVYDGQGNFGKMYGTCYGLLFGGSWGAAAYCGSRSRHASYARSDTSDFIGGRGASRVVRRA